MIETIGMLIGILAVATIVDLLTFGRKGGRRGRP